MKSTLAILSCTLDFAVPSFPGGAIAVSRIRKDLGPGSVGRETTKP